MQPDFHYVVRLLRALHPRYREMCLYAANHWSDEQLATAEATGDLPGLPGEVAKPRVPTLRLVSDQSGADSIP
jgi:hypothetical protein